MTPEAVTAGVLLLCAEQAPNRMILSAGAGGYASVHIYETAGIHLAPGEQTPENVLAGLAAIEDRSGEQEFVQGYQQSIKFAAAAAKALGIEL
jgi:hypothetical protein